MRWYFWVLSSTNSNNSSFAQLVKWIGKIFAMKTITKKHIIKIERKLMLLFLDSLCYILSGVLCYKPHKKPYLKKRSFIALCIFFLGLGINRWHMRARFFRIKKSFFFFPCDIKNRREQEKKLTKFEYCFT